MMKIVIVRFLNARQRDMNAVQMLELTINQNMITAVKTQNAMKNAA